jgi:hypothetical protein
MLLFYTFDIYYFIIIKKKNNMSIIINTTNLYSNYPHLYFYFEIIIMF